MCLFGPAKDGAEPEEAGGELSAHHGENGLETNEDASCRKIKKL